MLALPVSYVYVCVLYLFIIHCSQNWVLMSVSPLLEESDDRLMLFDSNISIILGTRSGW